MENKTPLLLIDEAQPKFKLLKKSFAFIITKKCNQNCKFCIWNQYHRDNSFVSVKFFEWVIKKMKRANYTICGLVGGEVGLHPQFKTLIDILIKHKIQFTLVSNGQEWEKYKFLLENPYNKYFNSIGFSLDGEPATHEKFHGLGTYSKIIEALDFFSSKKKKFSIKMVLRRDNYRDILHVFEIAKKYNAQFEAFDCLVSEEFTLDQPALDYLIKFVGEHKKELKEYDKKFGSNIRFIFAYNKGLQFCNFFDNRELSVYPNGDVGFCCAGLNDSKPIGNIKIDSVEKLMEKKCEVALFLINKIFPLIHSETHLYLKDSCAMCRYFMGCDK